MESVLHLAGWVYWKLGHYFSGTYTLIVIRAFLDLFSQLWIFLVAGYTTMFSVFFTTSCEDKFTQWFPQMRTPAHGAAK